MGIPVRFQSTLWTAILTAPDRVRSEIYTRYREPIHSYIQNLGFSTHDADDLTQEVFTRVCQERFLQRADKSKGKFRTLLLAVSRNVTFDARKKKARSLEQSGVENDAPDEKSPEPDFDRLWIHNLIQTALEALSEESSGKGPSYFEALVLHKIEKLSQKEVAERLGAKPKDVANWIQRAKEILKAQLTELVQSYSSSEDEFQEELSLVRRYLN